MNTEQPKQQTAVEWLFDNLNISGGSEDIKAFEQAKEIEKDQMKKIAEYWHFNGIPDKHFEEYYNEIYNK